MFEQVVGGASQSLRIVSELAETDVAGAADQPAERAPTVIVVDVKALLSVSGLSRCPPTNSASFSSAYSTNDVFQLVSEPQLSHTPMETVHRMLLRVGALQPTATSRASVVADPMAVTFLAPSSDAACSETALETLLRSDTFAAPAAGAFVVEVPVAVRVQAQPSATRRAAPSKRFYRRSGASAHVGHSALDAAGPVCIRRQS